MRKALLVAALSLVAATSACSSTDHGSMTTTGSSMADHSNTGASGSTPSGGGTTAAPIPADGPFNAADVAFAQEMIPHHGQAIEMADMALTRSPTTEVKVLAAKIKAAQDPEIRELTAWLQQWGQSVPQQPMAGMDHGSEGMAGMMTADDMKHLGDATGVAFDRMFLDMMIVHHEGAVTMANTELAEGKFVPATTMAKTIVETQTAEIAEMRQLLESIPRSE